MQLKYTSHFLAKLEDLFSETSYHLRYEKGNFQSGYCILNEAKIIVVNKYFPTEGKINSLIDILRIIHVNTEQLSAKNRNLFHSILQNELNF